MIPKLKQYKKWSLPSKYSFWGLIVGIAALAITIYTLFPEEDVLKQIAQEEYKPKVELVDAKAMQWLGDTEPFLTLYFENRSKGPAKSFTVDIYDGNEKIISKQISGSNMLGSGNLSMKPDQELGLPLISVSELQELLSGKGRSRDIVGFGLKANVPEQFKTELREKYVKDGNGFYSANAYPLFVQFSYKGITGSDNNTTSGFFVYLDTTGNG
ncbi:hypothetical protein [Oceanisphaera sp. W20_SRM_FM3]|uniref:hypothetical protein n=1 Tax=Oceanisphaera sp. W20_SRM_FM3 TaxID=3240267 RepID=UPI003F9D01F7